MTRPSDAARVRKWLRVTLAGPLPPVIAVAIVCGAVTWMPEGVAGINHLALPMIAFPAVWAGLFFHACLDRRLARAYAIHGTLLAVNVALIAPSVA